MNTKTNVGSIKTDQEFTLRGKVFKRVGYTLIGWDSPVKNKLYDIHFLPDAITGQMVRGHQDTIIVQSKETGAFYFAECREECFVDG